MWWLRITVEAERELVPEYDALEHVGADPSKVACIVHPVVGEVKPTDKGRMVGGTA
jgi:hypothetical protein